MLPWLLCSFADCPELTQGRAPAGLLSPREQDDLALLSNPARRRAWLLGRWCAKQLLQRVIQEQTGTRLPLDALSIVSDAQGAPSLCLEDATSPLAMRVPCLSLSHSGEYALCALALEGRVGVDIERVEERPQHLMEYVCTPLEQAQLQRLPDEERTLLLTIMWGAKEATLKARRAGMARADARRLSCFVPWPPLSDVAGWHPLTVQDASHTLPVRGGWRLHDEYVLTVVTLDG